MKRVKPGTKRLILTTKFRHLEILETLKLDFPISGKTRCGDNSSGCLRMALGVLMELPQAFVKILFQPVSICTFREFLCVSDIIGPFLVSIAHHPKRESVFGV